MSGWNLLRVLLAFALTSWAAYLGADTWFFEAKSSDEVLNFGKTRIVLTTDARKNRQHPEFVLRVFKANELQAQYRGIAFDQLFASSDNSLFLGLSNSGIPGTAAVIFDSEGNLRLLAVHGLAEFDYCVKSITVQREWYDRKNPEVKFVLDGKARGIYFRDCKGRTVELTDVVLKAYNRALDQTRAESARADQRER